MDVVGSARVKGYFFLALVAVAVLSVGVFIVMYGGEQAGGPRPSIEEYMGDASEIRCLKFKENVPVRFISREKLRIYMRNDLREEYPEGLENVERVMQAFGLISEGKDLEKVLLEYQTSQILGFYEPDNDMFYVVGEEDLGDLRQKMTVVHELTHALQDQHFDLQSLPLNDKNNDDISLSTTALIEGDATYVMLSYQYQRWGMSLENSAEGIRKSYQELLNTARASTGLENFPLFLRKTFMFPYYAGFIFVTEGMNGDWERINESYESCPVSTEQILHPEKFYVEEEKRDYPVNPVFPDLSSYFEGRELIENNRFGEYGVGALFLDHFRLDEDVGKNIEAREGWDGDRYQVFYSKPENLASIVWMTNWDSVVDAREFRERYGEILADKYPDAEIVRESNDCVVFDTGCGGVLLERRGESVLVLEGIPPKILSGLTTEIWSETSGLKSTL